jgi:membrane associated rhomboid family serine protease
LIPLRDSIRLTRWPLVTIALVGANVIAYLLSVGHGGSIVDGPTSRTLVAYGGIPYEFAHLGSHCELGGAGFSQAVLCTGQAGVTGTVAAQPPTWATAFSSMFVHANLLAILVNMAFLAVFGATLEARIGRLRFLVFYVVGGLVALALTVAASAGSMAPSVGASGAVAAVVGGYVLLHPRTRVLAALLPRLRTADLPAWALLGLWLALELVLGALHVITPAGGGVSTIAYTLIGGLGFGVLTVRAFARVGSAGPGPPPAAQA